MTRVDLDVIEAPTDSESGDAQHNPDVWELRSRITALVAELRAAREVVDAGRDVRGTPGWFRRLNQAVDAYDRAVGS